MAGKSSVGATGWVTAALAGVALSLTAAHVFPLSTAAANATSIAVQVVDRTHKSDRLNPAFSAAPDVHASGRTALRQLMERARSQELREMCEPPASPYVDPELAKLPGRCLT